MNTLQLQQIANNLTKGVVKTAYSKRIQIVVANLRLRRALAKEKRHDANIIVEGTRLRCEACGTKWHPTNRLGQVKSQYFACQKCEGVKA